MKPFRRAVLGSLEQPGDGRTQQSFIKGGSRPRFNLYSYPFIYYFGRKGTPSVYLLSTNGTPLTYLVQNFASLLTQLTAVNALFLKYEEITDKTRTFSRLFLNAPVSLIGPLMTDFPSFSYTSMVKPLPFQIPEKRHPFWAEPTSMAQPVHRRFIYFFFALFKDIDEFASEASARELEK